MNTRDTSPVYATLVLLLVLSGLDQTVLSTVLPSIVRSLHGQDLAPWVFSSYLMASTAVIPVYGKLSDRWGVRPLLLLATGLFTLGSLACALATSMPWLVAARGLQGLGGGGLMTLTMLAVATLYPPAERGRRMGLLGAAYSIATLLGPLAGGLLLEVAAWQWAFIVNVPCAAVVWIVLGRRRFGTATMRSKRFDAAGAALLAAALVALLWTTRSDAGSGTTSIAAAAAALLLSAWFVSARRSTDPVVPLGLFRDPAFAAASALSALTGVILFSAVVFLPTYLQAGLHLDALASALHTMPLMLGITIAAQAAAAALRQGRSMRAVAGAAAALTTLGCAALAALLKSQSAAWALGAALLPLGLGLGMLFPLVTIVAQRHSPPEQVGVGTALPVMLRSLGGALGVAWLGQMLHRSMAERAAAGLASALHATEALAAATGWVFVWATAAALVASIVALALPARPGVAEPARASA